MSDPRPAGTASFIQQGVTATMLSPEYKSFYAANFRFRITNTEANLTFTNLAELGGGMIAMRDEATLITTFSGLKVLSEHLALIVQVIEEELGPIRIPVAVRPSEEHRKNLRAVLTATPTTT